MAGRVEVEWDEESPKSTEEYLRLGGERVKACKRPVFASKR